MKTPMVDFPKRYANQPDPTGDEWIATYQKTAPLIEAGGIIALLGNRGTGKTRMAYEIAKNASLPDPMVSLGVNCTEALPAVYRTAAAMFAEIKATFHPKAGYTEIEILRYYRSAAVLVIDEIQESGDTDFERRTLTTVIDSRYQDERPTILIANMSREQFAAAVSPSIVSRMQECGAAFNFTWPSYRQRQ